MKHSVRQSGETMIRHLYSCAEQIKVTVSHNRGTAARDPGTTMYTPTQYRPAHLDYSFVYFAITKLWVTPFNLPLIIEPHPSTGEGFSFHWTGKRNFLQTDTCHFIIKLLNIIKVWFGNGLRANGRGALFFWSQTAILFISKDDGSGRQ